MLRKPDDIDRAIMAPARIVPLDRARTFIILLVLLHHSVINYTWFGHGDPMRWLGFDLVVLFNDSFFMACMFFISGLFVRDSLMRKGSAIFLRDRAWRLGVPFLISIFVLMPIAYYPTFLRYHLPGRTDFNFLHFWWHTLTVGPWPSGPAWFLWVLLAFDAMAAALWWIAPGMIDALGRLIYVARDRPMTVFGVFVIVSITAYLPMHLAFGDISWLEWDGFPLPIQTSRMLLYPACFFSGLAFAAYSAAMAFTVSAFFLRFAESGWRLLDALQPSAYGVFLLHYIFIIWLQYVVYDYPFPAGVKFAIVLSGTLSMSWGITVMLRKIPAVARMI